jgi:hypothetical protein
VASYTTLGSGFTAQTAGTVLSRLAQRLERQRQERLEAGSNLSGTTAYESVRPDSRLSFASSLPGPAPQQQSRGASLAQQASAARDNEGSHVAAVRSSAPLPPVAEEPTRVPSRPPAPPSDVSRAGSSRPVGDVGRLQAGSHKGSKEKMSTAEAMAAHMAAMQAAAAAVMAGGAVGSARPAAPASSSRGVPAPLPAPTGPPAGRQRGGGNARAPASADGDGDDPEDDLFDDDEEQRDGDDDGFSDESDEPQPRLRWRVGGRKANKKKTQKSTAVSRAPSRAASVDVEAPAAAAAPPPPSVWPPPNQPPRGVVKPPETRWFGIKVPQGLVARHTGFHAAAPADTSRRAANAAAAEEDGEPLPGEWTPTRLASAVSLLGRAATCVLVATGVAAAYMGRSSGRHIAMIAVSLGLALLAIGMLVSGAASKRAGPVLAGVALILVDGSALSSFCASQAEAVMLQCGFTPPRTLLQCSNAAGVRASTLVYAWALACCAVPLAGVAAMLALRLEVTDAVLRHTLAVRGGQLTSLARATVLPARV